MMKRHKAAAQRSRGMSLVELMIVVGVLGIVFAAVFFFFLRGTQQFHFTRRQNELTTAGRLALEQITDEVIWAGYLPHGGVSADFWHPIQVAEADIFTFYADRSFPWGQVTPDEYRNIFLGTDNTVHMTDNASMLRRAGHNITSVQFDYLDRNGAVIPQPLNHPERESVRHIRVTLTLQSTYMGDVLSTTMRTTISPRNLGLNRNIDPNFIPPPPLSGIVVLNIDTEEGLPSITADQYRIMNHLIYFGLTVVTLTDQQLVDYDYVENDIDLVILRDMPDPAPNNSHLAMKAELLSIPCPVICLDADDAALVYEMGADPATTTLHTTNLKVVEDHPIHDFVATGSTSFTMYDKPSTMNYLNTIFPETDVITSIFDFGSVPGLVAVIDEPLPTRRIFYGLPVATEYDDEDGMQFFYNVIFWAMGAGGGGGDPGDPITAVEDFEGGSGQQHHVILWADNLNDPVILPDSVPLFTDDFSGGKSLTWVMSSLGPSGRITYDDENLLMERNSWGAETRNIAYTVLPLGGYNINTDDLYFKVNTWRALNEVIGANDGVFFLDFADNSQVLYTENFNNSPVGATFWGDLHGRSRVHNPSWGGDGDFVTLDSRTAGNFGRVRMMLEVPTGGVPAGSELSVDYRFLRHNDQNHAYGSGGIPAGAGDFIGWNSHGAIDGLVNHAANLDPESYTRGIWHNRSNSFTISGAVPNPLYLIFSQYDNDRATSADFSRGISLDNVVVSTVDMDTTYSRFGVPSSEAGWRNITQDLNAAAQLHGVPFNDSFGVALSQSDRDVWPNRGIRWDDFEVGIVNYIYSAPGWSKGTLMWDSSTEGIDDWAIWSSPSNPSNYMWSLHANFPDTYSNRSHGYVETPSFSIPDQAVDPTMSFRHSFNIESPGTAWDCGYVLVSVAGGPWTLVGSDKGLNYTHTRTIGTQTIEVFSGSSGGWRTETIQLDTWKGQPVRFRFVFYSDASVTNPYTGWYLDDFIAECFLEGHEISSVSVKTPSTPSVVYDHVDIYFSSTDDGAFTGAGQLNPATMHHAYSGPVTFATDMEWQDIPLQNNYLMPSGQNLIVKIETQHTPMGVGQFTIASREDVCRAAWGNAPPTILNLLDMRPAMRFNINGSLVTVDEDGAFTSTNLPMSFNWAYTDFEAIYSTEDLGMGSGVTWTSGGINDDWEIGQPIFLDVDPPLIPDNGSNIAGNALTLNGGYYSSEAWAWLASSGYPMADALAYDTVSVRYLRCIRLSANDMARTQIAFGNDPDVIPPLNEDWITVREYDGVFHNLWGYETVSLTDEFNANASYQYYFIRFLLDSGVFAEQGGWNLDNIQFFGRTEGGK